MCGAVHNVLVVAMFAIEITVARLTVIHSEYNRDEMSGGQDARVSVL